MLLNMGGAEISTSALQAFSVFGIIQVGSQARLAESGCLFALQNASWIKNSCI